MDKKDRRVAVLVDSLRCGGAEKVAAQVSSCIDEVRWLLLVEGPKDEFWEPRNVSVVRLGFYDGKNIVLKGLNGLVAAFNIVRFIFRYKPDSVLSYLYLSHFVSGFTSIITPWVKRYYSERSVLHRGRSGIKLFVYATVLRFLYKRSAGVICISKYVMDSLVSNGFYMPKSSVIHNPVVTHETNLYLESKNTECGRSVIELCVVCSLSKVKNIEFLLRSLKELNRTAVDESYLLYVYGDGTERGRLETEAERLGITEQVKFQGRVKDPFFIAVQHDLFVFSSHLESFGNVCIESLSVGLPLVYANNLKSFDEILGQDLKDKLSYQSGDVDSFCRTLKRVYENRCEISKKVYERSHFFDLDVIINRYKRALSVD